MWNRFCTSMSKNIEILCWASCTRNVSISYQFCTICMPKNSTGNPTSNPPREVAWKSLLTHQERLCENWQCTWLLYNHFCHLPALGQTSSLYSYCVLDILYTLIQSLVIIIDQTSHNGRDIFKMPWNPFSGFWCQLYSNSPNW